jgi:phosphatidylserine/phosphatidylglycerophosphate/cardiolipin synthase-like enzyme
VAGRIARALLASPELRVIAVVPRYPDADGRVNGPPTRLGQWQAVDLLRGVAPDRVLVLDLENDAGVPIYVHAKVCIVDDVWFTCGSDNVNLRSWTNDSELTCAVVDGERDRREPADLTGRGESARRLPRDLRLQLWSEHLGVPEDDPALLDPATAFDLWRERADALDAWHRDGRRGPRPAGRVRHHLPEPLTGRQERWAPWLYRALFDPDGRPRPLRGGLDF